MTFWSAMSRKRDKPTPLDRYAPWDRYEEPCGWAFRGFYEEYAIGGEEGICPTPAFFRHMEDFFNTFSAPPLPPWNLFVDQWRHSLEHTSVRGLPFDGGPLLVGFWQDYSYVLDPPWVVPIDLDINVKDRPYIQERQLFWLALHNFWQCFTWEGKLTCRKLLAAWHIFLAPTHMITKRAVNHPTREGMQLGSYEQIYEERRGVVEGFSSYLRTFVDERIDGKGYFLPSHFVEEWERSLIK